MKWLNGSRGCGCTFIPSELNSSNYEDLAGSVDSVTGSQCGLYMRSLFLIGHLYLSGMWHDL
jgi:hypothetical protein